MDDGITPGSAGYAQVAGGYHRLRPGYPDALLAQIVARLGVPPPGTVIDVGAGTGRLAVQLHGAGYRVAAVEPLDAMRLLTPPGNGLWPVGGRAEFLPLRSGCADLVTVGQAWHWFSRQAAISEVLRVLRPEGAVLLIWNLWDTTVAWLRELEALVRRARPGGGSRFDVAEITEVFDNRRWCDQGQGEATHEYLMPGESVADLVLTSSAFADADAASRAACRDEVRQILHDHVVGGVDAEVRVSYRTIAIWARKR